MFVTAVTFVIFLRSVMFIFYCALKVLCALLLIRVNLRFKAPAKNICRNLCDLFCGSREVNKNKTIKNAKIFRNLEILRKVEVIFLVIAVFVSGKMQV